jgi:hypothetical protein
MRDSARQLGYPASGGTRGFVFNANLDMVVQLIEIGTLTHVRKK